jgi:hypothetical protein
VVAKSSVKIVRQAVRGRLAEQHIHERADKIREWIRAVYEDPKAEKIVCPAQMPQKA